MAIRNDSAPRRSQQPLVTPVVRGPSEAPAEVRAPRPAEARGHTPADGPTRAAPAARAGARRPDPRPMRIALAAGGLAGLSALVATIASSAVPRPVQVVTVQRDSPAEVATVRQVTRVVKLPPGATAPPAAGPNVVVTQLPAPVSKPRTVVVTTTQSGRVVP